MHLNESSKIIKRVKKKLNRSKKRIDKEDKKALIEEMSGRSRNKLLKIRKHLTKMKLLKLESPKNKELLMNKSEKRPKGNKSNQKIKTSESVNVQPDLVSSNYESMKKKKKRQSHEKSRTKSDVNNIPSTTDIRNFKEQKQLEKLKILISQKNVISVHEKLKEKPTLTLRQKMLNKLKAARFRFLNEQIYTTTSKEAEMIFKTDPESFKAYHEGYKQQVKKWPLNPLDIIVKSVNKMYVYIKYILSFVY